MIDHDVAAAARMLGVTERTVRRWLREGRLAAVKVGGRIRIPDSAIRDAAAPYGSDAGAAGSESRVAGSDPAPPLDTLMGWLAGPTRQVEARRLRLEAAARTMDEIRARSKPPAGPHDTAEALVREVRDERDERADRIHGFDRR